jgi:hypothetical protein
LYFGKYHHHTDMIGLTKDQVERLWYPEMDDSSSIVRDEHGHYIPLPLPDGEQNLIYIFQAAYKYWVKQEWFTSWFEVTHKDWQYF